MSPRLAFCLETAYAAGRSTLGLFGSKFEVEIKADETPVTAADKRAEEIVRAEIAAKYPGETVLGEEQGLIGASDDRWIVDPIDGTKSFVAGVPLYATLLSYEVAGQSVVAACYIPALDEMYYAEKGQGAFLNGRPISARQTPHIKDAVLLSGSFRSLVNYNRMDGFQKLEKQARMSRGWSDAYGHMLVARGSADVMIDPILARWDVSAPSLIVQEAGASFTDFVGSPELADEAISCVNELVDVVLGAFA